ncbi:hypothetical protein BKA64DRAFT_439684 [Cadophora sp. MPI-SDFR-AT-0126]|nr:hypothetical protein BKA64DRAFT_439684 [Leotiomycetes sp. MPI-SDFR-AT-0126]
MPSTTYSELRWGIIGCGMISSWFVADLLRSREDRKVKHVIQAIGSSSLDKAKAFVDTHAPTTSPTLHASYAEVYANPDVDIVYIGTPHSSHFQNAMDAIRAKKNVLCEKPFTINAKQTEALIKAAKEEDVYLMEGVWTRFFPIVSALQRLIHEEKVIGDISRMFMDFSSFMPVSSLSVDSRLADPARGAGALLDIGIYTLTWAALVLDQHPLNQKSQPPTVVSSMSFTKGADEMTSIILNYPMLKAQAICTSSMLHKGGRMFGRVEGSKGTVVIGGVGPSKPLFLIVQVDGEDEQTLDFPLPPKSGFFYEQDAIAHDLSHNRKESGVIPLAESLRMMRLMDSIRQENGLRYPQDEL